MEDWEWETFVSSSALIISTKEVMFSSAFVCFLAVCLFVSRITQNYSTDFHIIRWKGGAWAAVETVTFRWLPYLTLQYREDVLPPSAEASNGPNAHHRINRKGYKTPQVQYSPGSIPTRGTNEPSPSQVRAYSLGPTH